MSKSYVAYIRVSTAQQGASGLGLEAQERAVADYIARSPGDLIETFKEVESGKRADRPELAKALKLCELTGARLLIAKLDRLSRNLHFLSGLMEQGVDFVACDMPDANELTVHIMASVAQQERKAISARTTAALGSIKARLAEGGEHTSRRSGLVIKKLGSPKGLTVSRPDLGTAAVRAKADAFATRVGPMVRALRDEGLTLAAIADHLNERTVRTARGGAWTATAVKRVLERAA
jgi:DNA invertase Pin-like site-specific DNA recombinase